MERKFVSSTGGLLLVFVVAAPACVVENTARPAPAPAPATAETASASATAPATAPAPAPTAATTTASAQTTFEPTPEPTEQAASHPNGFGLGRPNDLKPGHPEALWIWHDAKGAGWHVRSTTASRLHRFSGRIWVTPGTIADVHPTRLEFNDRVRVQEKSIEFDFETQGGMDGFDFRLAGATCAKFALRVDGKREPGVVRIGSRGAHPHGRVFELCS